MLVFRRTFVFLVALCIAGLGIANAKALAVSALYDGETLERLEPSDIVSGLAPGSIVVIGEVHDSLAHHDNQRVFVSSFPKREMVPEVRMSVGMEFFRYTDQPIIDQFMRDEITEAEFLNEIQWEERVGFYYGFYRAQVRAPLERNGTTIGLNVPRSLTQKIAWEGLESLSLEERKLLPPNYIEGVGDPLYKERVKKIIKDQHPTVGEEFLENFWVSQSVWDDTMAWKAVEYIKENPDQVLVILVGNGHVEYGGGLPDRILARADSMDCEVCQVVTVPQVLLPDGVESFDNFAAAIARDENYGQYGDYLWLSDEEETIAKFLQFMREHKIKEAQEAEEDAGKAKAQKAQQPVEDSAGGGEKVGLKLSAH